MTTDGISFRTILFLIVGLVVALVAFGMLYNSFKSRRTQKQHLKWGHEIASNLPDDDNTVGPVRTFSRNVENTSSVLTENGLVKNSVNTSTPADRSNINLDADNKQSVVGSNSQKWAPYYQFNIVSRAHHPFTFERLKSVFAEEHLTVGEYDIVYYNDPKTGKELFRVASMIKPGTFPKGICGADVPDHSWSTKGICVIMFMPSPGCAEANFNNIISHVRAINNSLDGLLCTNQLKPMTDEVIADYIKQMKAYDQQQ